MLRFAFDNTTSRCNDIASHPVPNLNRRSATAMLWQSYPMTNACNSLNSRSRFEKEGSLQRFTKQNCKELRAVKLGLLGSQVMSKDKTRTKRATNSKLATNKMACQAVKQSEQPMPTLQMYLLREKLIRSVARTPTCKRVAASRCLAALNKQRALRSRPRIP